MRFMALVLSTLAVSASTAMAQTGFSAQTYTGILRTSKVVSADINGDGAPDLVSYNSIYPSSNAPANVTYNDGTGHFGAPVDLPGNFGTFVALAVADINGDSYPDVVGCYNTGSGDTAHTNVVVEVNNGGGSFTAKPAVVAPGMCYGLTIGDVYKTGHPAVITVGYPFSSDPNYPRHNYLNVFQSDNTALLTLAQTATPNTDAQFGPGQNAEHDFSNCGLIGVVGGDFFNHGTFDLVLTSACKPALAQPSYPAEGTVFYAAAGDSSSPGYSNFKYISYSQEQYHDGKVLDLQGNGTLDAVFLGEGGTYQAIQALINNSVELLMPFGSYTARATYIGGFDYGDLNGDGGKDLVFTSREPNAQPVLTIRYQQPSGYPVDTIQTTLGSNTTAAGFVALGDFNHDQRLDLATLLPDSTAQKTSLYVGLNTQSGAVNPCPAPTAANTSVICAPTANQQFPSGTTSVNVLASSNVTDFVHNRIYLDGQSVYDTELQAISTPLSTGNGTHHMVLVSWNKTGASFTSSTDFTIGDATSNGCIPSTVGVTICAPANGATTSGTQVVITAGAKVGTSFLTAMRVYIDNIAVYTSNNPAQTQTFQFTQPVDLNPGVHHLVVVAYKNDGSAQTAALNFTSDAGTCDVDTTGPNVRICTPLQGLTTASPVIVNASSNTSTGSMAAMRIYVDNVAVATINNDPNNPFPSRMSIQQQVPMSPGKHNLVIVGYPSTGGFVSGQRTVVIQ